MNEERFLGRLSTGLSKVDGQARTGSIQRRDVIQRDCINGTGSDGILEGI